MTFAKARTSVLAELAAMGWKLSTPGLKIPHATSPGGRVRLWFKAQAVHVTLGDRHSFGDARSLWVDLRVTTAAELVARAV